MDSEDRVSTLVSCLLVSHNKPRFCHEAIDSVLNQTYRNWELLVIDSGVLFDSGYFQSWQDNRYFQSWKGSSLKFIRSSETEEVRQTKAIAPWCFNHYLPMARGELVMYLCDDDILYSNAFQTFVYEAETRPYVEAMYASQDIGKIYPDGRTEVIGERRAFQPAGRYCRGVQLDCQIDYLQFCHRRRLLDRMPQWWPEEKETEQHADGIFMERVGDIAKIHPIDIKVSQNRRTPQSTYQPVR